MKKYVLTLLLVGVAVIFCACANGNVSIVEDESFYSDFYVDDNAVYINCTLTVEAPKDQRVYFVGDFEDEVEVGLLKERLLKTTPFDIQKGKQTIEVTFMGEFGGTNKKADRKLPGITVVTE